MEKFFAGMLAALSTIRTNFPMGLTARVARKTKTETSDSPTCSIVQASTIVGMVAPQDKVLIEIYLFWILKLNFKFTDCENGLLYYYDDNIAWCRFVNFWFFVSEDFFK